MEYILTGKEMKALDGAAIGEIGIPSLVLMENAARSAAEIIEREKRGKRILIVAGVGNNGADGLCIYRILKIHGLDCTCMVAGKEEKATEEYLTQKKIIKNLHFPLEKAENREEEFLQKYDVIVDGLFGVGLSRDVTGEFAGLIQRINDSGAYVYAVDIPSGISAEDGQVLGLAVKADCTVTFGYQKVGTIRYPGKSYCGRVVTADIGYPGTLCESLGVRTRICTEEDLKLLPERCDWGNKGTFGKVLIAAGSSQYCGAAVLAAKAAYRMGAGMVKVVTHRNNKEVLCARVPEVLGLFYQEGIGEKGFWEELEKAISWSDVIVLGPGLSREKQAAYLVAFFLKYGQDKQMILDADALNLISERNELREKLGPQMVLTPHLMEMSRLAEKSLEEIKERPAECAAEFAAEYGCRVVLKDAVTIVTDGRDFFYNTSGNSGMAVAGSGDVLSGMLGAACAWNLPLLLTAALTAYIHGKAGDMAAERYGKRGMTAWDIAEELSFLKKYDEIRQYAAGERTEKWIQN